MSVSQTVIAVASAPVHRTRTLSATNAANRTARFLLTTASLAAKKATGQVVPPDHVFDPALRLRVLGEVARLLPDTLRRRSRAAHGDRRAPTVRHWSGRDHDAGEVR